MNIFLQRGSDSFWRFWQADAPDAVPPEERQTFQWYLEAELAAQRRAAATGLALIELPRENIPPIDK